MKSRNKGIIIAIDGPAGSGKSTTARFVARQLNYIYIDTGAMYRACTWAWMLSDRELVEPEVCRVIDNSLIELKQGESGQIVLLDGKDISEEIRRQDVTKFVSPISAMGEVRERMVAMQQSLGAEGGVVMDGRDIGTVVFPDAELKIFLIASVGERAERRYRELQYKESDQTLESIREAIIYRDNYDSNREISPLRKANDAVELDTTHLTIEQQCNFVVNLAKNIITNL